MFNRCGNAVLRMSKVPCLPLMKIFVLPSCPQSCSEGERFLFLSPYLEMHFSGKMIVIFICYNVLLKSWKPCIQISFNCNLPVQTFHITQELSTTRICLACRWFLSTVFRPDGLPSHSAFTPTKTFAINTKDLPVLFPVPVELQILWRLP